MLGSEGALGPTGSYRPGVRSLGFRRQVEAKAGDDQMIPHRVENETSLAACTQLMMLSKEEPFSFHKGEVYETWFRW